MCCLLIIQILKLLIAAEPFPIDFMRIEKPYKVTYPPEGIHLLNLSEYRFIWRRAGGQILTGSSVSELKSNLVYSI